MPKYPSEIVTLVLLSLCQLPWTEAKFVFRVNDGIIEVLGRNKRFAPLCSDSYTTARGDEACSAAQRGVTAWSEEISVPPESQSLSIACIGLTNCFVITSPDCPSHIRLSCRPQLCQPPNELIGTGCVWVHDRPVQGYSSALDACEGRGLLSLDSSSSLETLLSIVTEKHNITRMYLTSGVRVGTKWKWDDDREIQISPLGSGRCLAISNGIFTGVDCDSELVYPLCQSGWDCLRKGEKYEGDTDTTETGAQCLKWPSVAAKDAPHWSHSLCRMISNNTLPGCYVHGGHFEYCNIPECPKTMRHEDAVDTCPKGEVSCGNSIECIPKEFVCDYDPDCKDGADEKDCEDHLKNFELIGAFKLVEKISEIWTNIPNVQGCASRCETSSLLCEAFSFAPRTQICLLTDSSDTNEILIHRSTSQFYRRRFSAKEIEFNLLPSGLLAVAKGDTWAAVCDDGFSREYATNVCGIFGFGRALGAADPPSKDPAWTLQCLRSQACLQPNNVGCLQLRCSQCLEAVCGDGTCISREHLCDGRADCDDGSDEKSCGDVSWRLINGEDESSGHLEVYFHGEWEPVCTNGVNAHYVDRMCSQLEMGHPGAILPPIVIPDSTGRLLNCTSALPGCHISAQISCRLQVNLQCTSPKGSNAMCGVRSVHFTPKDPAKMRFARVVGGFEATAGAFPWTAAIRLKARRAHHCGATIIHQRYLLTAAHCFEEDRRPDSYEVIVGDWDNNVTEGHEQLFNISRLHFYPLYEDLFAHDLAIIELPRPGVKLSPWASLVCLPPRDFRYFTGRRCVIAGWGSMGLRYPTRLQAALVPMIERQRCVNSSKIYESMSRSAFCAGYLEGGIDSCQGDSGGPLVCQQSDGIYYLAGVISWGDGCAQKNQPGIYTMVAPYLSWINDTIRSNP